MSSDEEAASVASVVRDRVMPKITNWPSTGSAPSTFMFWAIWELVRAGYTITPPKRGSMSVEELTERQKADLRRDVEALWPKMEAGMRYLSDK